MAPRKQQSRALHTCYLAACLSHHLADGFCAPKPALHETRQSRISVFESDDDGQDPADKELGRPPDDDEVVGNDFLRALCIIPPTKKWDRLQRARHYAGDPAFQEWPPAVRLFHPFTGTALDLAQVVEELDIQPFQITFDTWVVVPNVEALQMELMNANVLPSVVEALDTKDPRQEKRDRETQELILSEEKIGKQKHIARRKATGTVTSYEEPVVKKSTPADKLEEQKRLFDEFGGPCILCLEPDPESKEFLIDIRQQLADLLDHDPYSSPSSIYCWRNVDDMDMGYRPLIPISSFPSLQSAMHVARRLKGLWGDPLTIDVNEFHLISCRDDKGQDDWDLNIPRSMASFGKEPWMCNAKVMLMGEEMQLDTSKDEEMVRRLVEEGEPGGLDISNDYTILDDEEEISSDIKSWLDDDDWDEGSQVIIGRTHFYYGEQRAYPGMPASSVIDGRDRSMGNAGGPISGLARRRRSTYRQGGQWEEGEYGHRDIDYLPWSKKERKKKGGVSKR